ncbi:MAG: hypothetical protein V1698_02660, partial [bacterium]
LQKDGGIIIATQLAAKIWLPEGLDLIGFMYADRFLNRPDFRASERAFQIVRELAGRLNSDGQMIIQTFNPENKTLLLAASGKNEEFYRYELENRKKFGYPPFSKLLKISLDDRDRRILLKNAQELREILTKFKNIEIISQGEQIKNLKSSFFIVKVKDFSQGRHLEFLEILSENFSDKCRVEFN